MKDLIDIHKQEIEFYKSESKTYEKIADKMRTDKDALSSTLRAEHDAMFKKLMER